MWRYRTSVSDLTDWARGQDSAMITAKLYYFSFFAAIGALVPFFNIYLQGRGLSGTEIGLLGSLGPLVALASNPFWGGLADRYQIHQKVLIVCVLGAGLLSLPFIWLYGFWPILFVLLLMIFFRVPIPPLLDSTVMTMLSRNGASYGRQRLFGSIGFLLTSLGLGRLMGQDDLSLIFWTHGALLAIACTFLSFHLPFERQPHEQNVSMWRGLRSLAGERSYVSLLLLAIFMGFGSACFTNFVGLRLISLGGDNSQVGLGFALNALTEIPVMFLGARLMSRFGTNKLIVVAVAGLATVHICAGLAPTATTLMFVMPMVGIFTGAYWISIVVFASQSAPAHLRATGQSLVGAAQGGIGFAVGGITAGILWDQFGGTVVLVTGGVSLLIGCAIFLLGQRQPRRMQTAEVIP